MGLAGCPGSRLRHRERHGRSWLAQLTRRCPTDRFVLPPCRREAGMSQRGPWRAAARVLRLCPSVLLDRSLAPVSARRESFGELVSRGQMNHEKLGSRPSSPKGLACVLVIPAGQAGHTSWRRSRSCPSRTPSRRAGVGGRRCSASPTETWLRCRHCASIAGCDAPPHRPLQGPAARWQRRDGRGLRGVRRPAPASRRHKRPIT